MPVLDPDASTQPVDDTLFDRARAGDEAALDALLRHHVPALRRWATGRLPRWCRELSDTSDLIQETVIATLRQLEDFEDRGPAALQAYLKQAVVNRIRNELRRVSRRPVLVNLDDQLASSQPSPFDEAARAEFFRHYERALGQLTQAERNAIVLRVEMGLSYGELADVLEKPSPDAARMFVVRALVKAVDAMGEGDGR
jgi:RNA polymerase sigma factor (sigma-70 family)